MNRLRKTFAWLWRIKERIVLATMVAILCYRVYKVIYPDQEEGPGVSFTPARPTLALDAETVDSPPSPPSAPPQLVVSRLWNYNMFQYQPGGAGADGNDAQSANVDLIRIAPFGDSYRASIRTATATKWYSEGEKFETFEVLSIDPEGCGGEGAVRIADESTSEILELCKE